MTDIHCDTPLLILETLAHPLNSLLPSSQVYTFDPSCLYAILVKNVNQAGCGHWYNDGLVDKSFQLKILIIQNC